MAIIMPTVHVNFYLLLKYLELLISIAYIHFLKNRHFITQNGISLYRFYCFFIKKIKINMKSAQFSRSATANSIAYSCETDNIDEQNGSGNSEYYSKIETLSPL